MNSLNVAKSSGELFTKHFFFRIPRRHKEKNTKMVNKNKKEWLKVLVTLIFVVVLVVSFSGGVLGATIYATSCEQVDVQAAIDFASSGDIVMVPAGSCNWSSEVEITKSLSVIGAGLSNTILIANGDMSHGFFYIDGFTSSELMRVSGFYFDMINWTSICGIYISSTVDLSNLRIDNNKFNQGGIAQIFVMGSKGVIDNNYFHNGGKAISYSGGSYVAQDASWDDLEMGSSNALFIEDNYFIDNKDVEVYSPSIMQERIGTFGGGKLVIRYNIWDATAYDNYTAYSPLMTHGSALDYYGGPVDGQYRRGQSTVEIYNNVISAYRILFCFILRGSANIIYNNTITTVFPTNFARLNEEEFYSVQWEPLRTEWPGEDQIHNTFIWNNIVNGYSVNITHIYRQAGNENVGIQENRDFFMHEPQATGGRATFIGRNGAAGSYPTDGTLYPYTGTMIFNSSGANAYYPYTPYTYPHPLTLLVDPICSEKGGVDCCTGGEICNGTSYGTASDCTGICCSVICTAPTCTDAGGTCQTNTCDTYIDCISLIGTCVTGSCCSGTCTSSSTTCSPADTDTDGVVSIVEIMGYITSWKAGSVDIVDLITGITEWKSGCV